MTDQQQAAGRIIFVNRFFFPDESATSQMLSDLAFALASDGYRIMVVTSRLRYEDPGARLPACETVKGVQVRRIWTSRFGRSNVVLRALDYFTFYLSAFFVLLRVCSRGDVLVAKTDPPMISVVAASVAAVRGCKTINWLQDVFPEVAAELGMLRKRGLSFRLMKRLRDWSLRRASCNVVLGKRMAEYIERCNVSAQTIKVIPNWADGKAIKPLPRVENPLRTEWGIGDRFVVGYCGNLGRAHDWESILAAATELRERPDTLFLVVGGGSGYKALKKAAASERLENIVFQPYQERCGLRSLLTLPDVHLISLHPHLEGLIVPSKFYGALAAGRAVLYMGEKHGDVTSDIQSSDSGWQVSFGDSRKAIDVVRAVSGDQRVTDDKGANARRLFDSRFNSDISFSAWRNVLAEPLNEVKEIGLEA